MSAGMHVKNWSAHDLSLLRRLRERFLSGDPQAGDYWKSDEELGLYDKTFAVRIGWKWDSMLAELSQRDWKPKARHLFDLGCGTGIASRKVLKQWPGHFGDVWLHDRSAMAARFAGNRIRSEDAGVTVTEGGIPRRLPEGTALVVSHMLNELPDGALETIIALARQATEVLWVEAATHPTSRRLVEQVRERLRGEFHLVAPCPHQAACGMLTLANDRHWCHFFAKPPSAIFQDSSWGEFSRELGIDLRSLPYSFLVLQRDSPQLREKDAARFIGHSRDYKGYSKVLTCREEGVADLTLQKRDAPELLRAVRQGQVRGTLHVNVVDEKIKSADPPGASIEPRQLGVVHPSGVEPETF